MRPIAILVAPRDNMLVKSSIDKLVVQLSLYLYGWEAFLKEGDRVIALGDLLPDDKRSVRLGILGYSYSIPIAAALPSHSRFILSIRLKDNACVSQDIGSFSTL